MKAASLSTFFLFTLCFHLGACTTEPKPQLIIYGKDACEHCHMVISDQRFGGQIVTRKGKHFSFDSVNCLHQYLQKHTGVAAGIYVVDSLHRDQWIEAAEAQFKLIPTVRSPMGAGLFSLHNSAESTAIPEARQLTKAQNSEGTMSWQQLTAELDAGKYR
jgi:copper chaperone NosL